MQIEKEELSVDSFQPADKEMFKLKADR